MILRLRKLPSIEQFVNESRKMNESTSGNIPRDFSIIHHADDGTFKFWDGAKFESDESVLKFYTSRQEVEEQLDKAISLCTNQGYTSMPYIRED